MMIPIRNFGDMGGGLYRSAQPEYMYEWKWLKNTYNIGKVINLRSEIDIDSRFAPLLGMEAITIPVDDHEPPTEQQADEFIQLIKYTNLPVLFHCEHGHGRTSTFAVIARLSEGWNLEDALREEAIIFGYFFKHPAQLEFLNKYAEKLSKSTTNETA